MAIEILDKEGIKKKLDAMQIAYHPQLGVNALRALLEKATRAQPMKAPMPERYQQNLKDAKKKLQDMLEEMSKTNEEAVSLRRVNVAWRKMRFILKTFSKK